jgi:hypothetical protein
VSALRRYGLNKSAITRVERIGWNTVDRCVRKSQASHEGYHLTSHKDNFWVLLQQNERNDT